MDRVTTGVYGKISAFIRELEAIAEAADRLELEEKEVCGGDHLDSLFVLFFCQQSTHPLVVKFFLCGIVARATSSRARESR